MNILAILATAALVATSGFCAPEPAPLPTYTLAPCADEGQETDCYWDASEMGNGTGQDFIVFQGQVFYPAG